MTRWFTTDTHFGHPLVSALRGFTRFDPDRTEYKRILAKDGAKAAQDWVRSVIDNDRRLTFKRAADTDAHDKFIVDAINAKVHAGDELWILGDIAFRTTVEHMRDCLTALDVTRIRIILGNHDDWWDETALPTAKDVTVEPHATIAFDEMGETNLSHYPYRESLGFAWPGDVDKYADVALPDDGRPLLYGHTHQLSPAGATPRQLNVGLDAWNLAPVSEAQVAQWFKERAAW